MVKKYFLQRIPEDVFKNCKAIKVNMEKDVKAFTGKSVSIPMTQVLRAITSKNENYIQVDLKTLAKMGRGKK